MKKAINVLAIILGIGGLAIIVIMILIGTALGKRADVFDPQKVAILVETDYNILLEKKYGLKSWNPTHDDLVTVDNVINEAIKNQEFNFLKEPIKENIEKHYYMQFIPYLSKSGEKIIKINAFCEIMEIPPNSDDGNNQWTKMDWRNEVLEVDDGGNCYWQIMINVDEENYDSLTVNGLS